MRDIPSRDRVRIETLIYILALSLPNVLLYPNLPSIAINMADQLAQLTPAELSKMPSMRPPPGAVIDFDGPNPLERTTITVTSTFMGIALFFVSIRAYTKVKIYGKGSWDDRKYLTSIQFQSRRSITDPSVVTCALGLVSSLIIFVFLRSLTQAPERHAP